MQAPEIRRRFLQYFERHGHAIRPSASLVPADDPTLLFVNAGMVPFKKVFLGLETPAFGNRATTAQKCVRAGGKHNDLEQVGHTARHHTFFEMLGNFSFGDYFKRDAIRFAWEFVTSELGLDPGHLFVTVYHEDADARALWREIAGMPDERIYGLGERDNFWQMADTGPCGPCSEIYVDLARVAKDWQPPPGGTGEWTDPDRADFSTDEFVEGAEAGRFLEIWNLVFMEFDRSADGTLTPLPKPSIDTGAGLERIAAVMQGVTSNFHTDLFLPLIATVEETVGIEYRGRTSDEPHEARRADGRTVAVDPASFRVIADHARAVAFLLADGVFPSNEGRGYVLRRILRRAVRHAWLLGRSEPTLAPVVDAVCTLMSDAYPELSARRQYLVDTTRAEEERFLATIDEGMARFEKLAPAASTQGSTAIRGTISGRDAFRLYDTYGFPIDLLELMARERGYTVNTAGFNEALEAQRAQSQEDRRARQIGVSADELADLESWERADESADSRFVGYDTVEITTQVAALRRLGDDRAAVLLRETPFYAESGGQVSDLGEIVGNGWRLDVDEVRKVEGRIAAVGRLTGNVAFGPVTARVPHGRRRDTERHHTATHLLHAALRNVLGEHVHQAGSLVAPDRLRFDFTHHGPLKPEQLERVQQWVNDAIFHAVPVATSVRPYKDAIAAGAMALFGEKYGDEVRVVEIPGLSAELCGGTHVSNTAMIGLFVIVSEAGVGAGIRRIEALAGPHAYQWLRERERQLVAVGELLRTPVTGVEKRVRALLEERRPLERRLTEAMRGGAGGQDSVARLIAEAENVEGGRLVVHSVPDADVKSLQALGDALRERMENGVAVLATAGDGKASIVVVVTDDLRERGVRADAMVRGVASVAGGRGGGKPHMAQAGIPEASRLEEALSQAPEVLRGLLAGVA